MASTTVALRNEANTSTTTSLTNAFNVWWQPQANAPGIGGFSIPRTDTTTIDALTPGSVVLFSLDGTARFPARITEPRHVEVDQSDEHGEAATFSCTGLAIDLWDEWVEPISGYCDFVPSSDKRIWAWYAPGYAVGSWDNAIELAAQGWSSTFYTGQPAGFTDEGAFWIWSDDGTTENAPSGACLFVDEVEVTAGEKFLEWGADNEGVLFINGEEKARTGDFRSRSTVRFETTAGTLRIAAIITNALDDGPPGGNPGAWVASLRHASPTGTVIWKTTDAVRVLAYPVSFPEISVGVILDDIETLSDWTLAGTSTADTATNTYPTVPNYTARIYEDSIGDVLDDLATEHIDWLFSATGKTLEPYVKGALEDTVGMDLVTGYSTDGQATPDDVNVLDLTWDVRRPEAASIGVRWRDAWRVRGTGRPKKAVRAEQLLDTAAADAYGDALLALYGTAQQSATFTYLPLDESTDLPYEAFNLHELWPLPSPGDQDTTTEQRIHAFTINGGPKSDTSERDAGGGIEVEVGDPIRERIERVELAARRGVGSLGGLAAGTFGRGAPIAEQTATARVVGPAETTVRLVSDPSPAVRTANATNAFVGWVTSLRMEGMELPSPDDGDPSTYEITIGGTTYTLSGSGDGLLDVVSVGALWDTTMPLVIEATAVGHTNINIYAEIGSAG